MMDRATYLAQSSVRLLNDWGSSVRRMFPGHIPYLVGSALTTADHRDVDIRLMLADRDYDTLAGLVNLSDLNLATSLWGELVTGLPIDFQVQRTSDANQEYDGRRHALLGVGS